MNCFTASNARSAAAARCETTVTGSSDSGLELAARRRARDRQLLLVHVRRDVGEERRAEVALAGVRQHAEDVRALLRLGGDLERPGEGSARGDTDEDAFLRGEVLAALDGLRVRDR